MATITAQAATADPTAAFTAASVGGDTIAIGTAQHGILHVRNGSASPITATLAAVQACSQGFTHNVAVTCAVGDTVISIPPACLTASGNCGVTYSAVTSVTVAAYTA